jgi:divinyl chlorophyllide a 8-vinyl-reductase
MTQTKRNKFDLSEYSDQYTPPVILLGATGTIGQATLKCLISRGYFVKCFLRRRPCESTAHLYDHPKVEVCIGDLSDPDWLSQHLFPDDTKSAIISCIASRTGTKKDAWAVDYGVNKSFLDATRNTSIKQFVLLSAICVQKPVLEFQKAKLAFEADLRQSDIAWTIVRPTAFFKSLSGQVDRLKKGKPFLVFGTGQLTSCKPISDGDLARFIVDSLNHPDRQGAILPIGGPGPALTPLEQGRALFAALEKPQRFRQVPVAVLDLIIGGLRFAGLFSAKARNTLELACIGRYYATESLLVMDPKTGRYCSDMTNEFGTETLIEFYRDLATEQTKVDLGEHSVF